MSRERAKHDEHVAALICDVIENGDGYRSAIILIKLAERMSHHLSAATRCQLAEAYRDAADKIELTALVARS